MGFEEAVAGRGLGDGQRHGVAVGDVVDRVDAEAAPAGTVSRSSSASARSDALACASYRMLRPNQNDIEFTNAP